MAVLRRRFAARTTVVVACVVVGIVGTASDDPASATSDREQVPAVVARAINLHYADVVNPTVHSIRRPSPAALDKLRSAAVARVRDVYGDGALARQELESIDGAFRPRDVGGVYGLVVAGGANRFAYDDIAVAGDTATVSGSFNCWQKMMIKGPDKRWRSARPHSIATFTATLRQDAPGHWIMADYTWHVVPGSGP